MSITNCLSFKRTTMATLLATTLTAGLIGCSSDDDAPTTSTIDGSVFASSVSGASCNFYDAPDNVIAGPFTTSSFGTYSVSLPNASLAGDLALVCEGGTYTDEATGTTVVMQTSETMAAYVAGGTLSHGSSVHATPGSTIVFLMVTANNPKTLTDAEETFNTAFGYTPDTSIAPTDATVLDAEATDEELLAGLRAAAFSQLTEDLMLSAADQFSLLKALADDLSDNKLNGLKGGGSGSGSSGSPEPVAIGITGENLPVDIQNQFATSFLNFHDNPVVADAMMDPAGNDMTGLTADKIGTLPFGTTALTTSYQVDYVEGSMMAMHGKTKFQISLTNLSDDSVATAKTVMLMPMMYMSTKSHSTPVDNDGACIESLATAGTYDCTVYYVMSTMMGGYWDLKVMSNGEAAHFIPEVMMAMGDTPMARLKSSDLTMNMMGTISTRSFLPFKSSLTGSTGAHTFELYTATMETMMSFPTIYDTAVLNFDTINELTISPMEVLVSTDPAFVLDTVTATDEGNGYWTAAGITGLTNSVEGTLYVQMTINGYVLNSSIDGVYVDEATTPSSAAFTVTPKMAMP